MDSNFLQTQWPVAPHPPTPSSLQPRAVGLTSQSPARPEVHSACSLLEAVTRTLVGRNSVSFPHGSCLLTMKSRIQPSKVFASSAVRPGAVEALAL